MKIVKYGSCFYVGGVFASFAINLPYAIMGGQPLGALGHALVWPLEFVTVWQVFV